MSAFVVISTSFFLRVSTESETRDGDRGKPTAARFMFLCNRRRARITMA